MLVRNYFDNVTFPERVPAICDVRGGTLGISEYQYNHYDAICLAADSLRDLEVTGNRIKPNHASL